MDFTREQIRDQFDKLTPKLKKIIAELDMEGLTDSLHKKYGLHLDKLGILATEITISLVGLARPADFRDRLVKKIGVSEDIANLIVYDLNQEIFSKIREDLEKLEPQSLNSKQIFDQKMGGISNVPKQEIAVEAETGDNEEGEEQIKTTHDPYREPIK